MSEELLDREPIQLVDITLPKCANDYGCAPCRAGLGEVSTGDGISRNFMRDEIGSWTGTNLTLTRDDGGILCEKTAGLSTRFEVTGATGFSGSSFRYIVVTVRSVTDISFSGIISSNTFIYYENTVTSGLTSTARRMNAVNENVRFRGQENLLEIPPGRQVVLVYDAADSTDYNTEWVGRTIDGIRLDMGGIQTGEQFYIESVQVCSENLYERAGSECYRTRATCQAPADYRDVPDRNRSPALRLSNGGTVPALGGAAGLSLSVSCDIVVGSSTPRGIIFEIGSVANGIYCGIRNSNNLEFRLTSGGNTAVVSFPVISDFLGQSFTLYFELNFDPSTSAVLRAYSYNPVERATLLLGEDSITPGALWADSNGGAVGQRGGTEVGAGGDNVNWNGEIPEVRFYTNTLFEKIVNGDFRKIDRLGRGVKGEPKNEGKIYPCLNELGTISTKLNLSGADDDYRPIGRRATLDFTAVDFQHSDIGQDPYQGDRRINPFDSGTFWTKWLERQRFGKVGALVRVRDGYAGQAVSEYKRRLYIIDKVTRDEAGANFYCRDVLSRTEFSKAQVPAPSSGILETGINNSVLAMSITGDVTDEYPASGTVRINDEILTYSARSYDSLNDETDFTLTARGTDGSTAAAHDAEDLVQLCRRYSAVRIKDALQEWLLDDAGIEGQFIDIAGIISEDDEYLTAYTLTGLLTEPQPVDNIIGRCSQECSFQVFWNERRQRIEMLAIRGIARNEALQGISYEENIIRDSFKLMEKPKQRLNVINFYFNPIDFTRDLNQPGNFKNGLQTVNSASSLPEQYGGYIQKRDIFSLFLSTEAQAAQTSGRLSLRYADVPQFAEFLLDAKDREIWVGDYIQIDHPLVCDEQGRRVLKRWQIVEAEELDPGHLIRYMAADISLEGEIREITTNAIRTYTPEGFELGYAYITDASGLNPDGTTGATIT